MARLKDYLPKSLLWRSVLIVVLPMVILQVVVASLIVKRHFDGVTRQMTEGAAAEIRLLVDLVDRSESAPDAQRQLAAASRSLGYWVRLEVGATLPPNESPMFFDVIGRALEDTLRDRLGLPLFINFERDSKFVDVRAQSRFGVLEARLPHRRIVASNPHLLLTWSAGAALALIAVALLYLRNQIRPIEALAAAADAFGKGRSAPLHVSGAREVRSAASAFLDARARIERHIEQRTRMLSGVSHDLRTPLTRLKLGLELMDDGPELGGMRKDVEEMERILEEFLAYARGDQGEAVESVDVIDLIADVAEAARRKGGALTLFEQIETPSDTAMSLRPTAIKRTLHNLIENAFAYGEKASLSLRLTRSFFEVAIEDDGPGIPAEERETAFRPFHRLDEARNQNRGSGVGLGLALALDTVRGHGGDLRLEESAALGGLRAVVRLPR